MLLSRRAFLAGSVAAAWSGSRSAGQGVAAPFTIDVTDVALARGVPTFVAVNTSGYTSCEVSLLDPSGRVRSTSRKWSTEPDVSNGQAIGPLVTAGEARVPIAHTVRIAMQPTRAATPSMAMALMQVDPAVPLERGIVQQARTSPAAPDPLEDAKRMARLARFVDDPATPPGGRFLAALTTDSSIQLRIWQGEAVRGAPIHQAQFKHLPAGTHEVPWNLATRTGPAPTGRYLGVLLCVPVDPRLRPTTLAAYFAVRTP